jgi:hypothetical protein
MHARAQARELEDLGLNRKQAEGLTRALTEQIVRDRVRLTEQFVAKFELEKVCSFAAHWGWRLDCCRRPLPGR